jgi:D-alanyl-D-alanine carboxypeptidase
MSLMTREAAVRALTGAVLTTTLLAGAATLPATAAPHPAAPTPPPAPAGTPGAGASHESLRLQREVTRVLKDAGFIGITVRVRDGHRKVYARAGEAELNTGRPMPLGADLRIASVTKAFVATVVLQLEAEGRLSLDDAVERWLPGVVSGNGNDGRRITVRHLLQHTSGIHNHTYSDETGDTAADFERTRFDHVDPERMVAGALRHRPDFPPASADDPEPDWNYSNTGYYLAGMIIEKVTGRAWAEEVRDRVVRPLGLTDTYAPGDDPYLRGPHAHTYQRFRGSAGWTDTTVQNLSWGGAAAALISSDRDVDRFFTALLDGRLLPAAQLAEMRRAVPVGDDFQGAFPGLHYGLGLMRQPLSCGGYTWGHGGDLEGSTVRTGFTEGGRRSVVVAATGKTADDGQLIRAERALQKLVDQALCESVR